MKALLDRLHAKLGDLWWYSLMIFIACRSGDVIQAFIGLWLVPKYVGPEELGAVLPLQQLSNLFAVPLAVLATVFAKYVNTYATRGEYGKVRSFIRDVLWTACGVFLICIVIAYLVIPHFYVRLNVASGMLTVLILAAGFASNIANLFTSALQGLKKFKTMTIQNLISAPIRLATLLLAMPIRALSGYILGQATPPATCSFLAAWSLHKDLKSIPLDTSWRKDLPEIWRYIWPVAIYMGVTTIAGTIQMTVYRQRLPEIESSAFYLLSRFAETAGYVSLSMTVVMFPMASEAHEQGQENRLILHKTLFTTFICTMLMAIGFYILARPMLSLNSTWHLYAQWASLLPVLTLTTGLAAICGSIVSYEIACRRYTAAYAYAASSALLSASLVVFTGYTFFIGIFPQNIIDAMACLNLAEISHITYFCFAVVALQTALLLLITQRKSATTLH